MGGLPSHRVTDGRWDGSGWMAGVGVAGVRWQDGAARLGHQCGVSGWGARVGGRLGKDY